MKLFIYAFLALMLTVALSSCSTVPTALPLVLTPALPPLSTDTIANVVKGSKCSLYTWGDKDSMLKDGFLEGLVAVYAKTLCTPSTASSPIGLPSKDALAFYERPKGHERRQVFALMPGLAMRESDGNYTCGWDTKAPPPRDQPRNAEAGAFQVSYDSMTTDELKAIFAHYKAHPEECLNDLFGDRAPVSKQSIKGTPGTPEYDFQKTMRSCGALQAEYAAVDLRIARTAWGPINTTKAIYYTPCEDMFAAIESAVVCK